MNLKLPPQNIDAEKAVIGAVLIDNTALDKIIGTIQPQFFYDPKHALIMEAVFDLHSKSEPVDVLTLTNQLKRKKKLRQAGGTVYLSEIVSAMPTSANVSHYAELVREMSVRRGLIQFSGELDENARDEGKEVADLLDDLEKKLLSVSEKSVSEDFLDSMTLLDLQMKRADEFAKNPDGIRGIPTGLKSLDGILHGLHPSDLIILAARPSVGKSAFAISLARHAAVNENKTVAFFSLEMPGVQIIERMLAQQMRANLWNIRMGKLTEDEVRRYPEGYGKLGEANLFIDETPGITIMQLRSKIRRLMIDKGIDMVVIDYLQLMQTRDIENRAQAVGEISRSLKVLARELNIPIVALSQLNRAIESRGREGKVPQLSDLRESGSLEQDADLVMFLSREKDFDEEEGEDAFPEQVKIQLSVAKHRNGPIGSCQLLFYGAQQRYEDA